MRQVFFDTETTGLKDDSKIVEIAAIEANNGVPTGRRLHMFFNPQQPMDDEVIAIHGLTSDRLKNEPLFKEKASEMKKFLAGAELVAHNIAYDIGRLNYEFSFVEEGFDVRAIAGKITDTYEVAGRLLSKKIKRFSLDNLMAYYKISKDRRPRHEAMLDTEILLDVYNFMLEGIDLSKPGLEEDIPRSAVQRLEKKVSLARVEISAKEESAEKVFFENWPSSKNPAITKKRLSL